MGLTNVTTVGAIQQANSDGGRRALCRLEGAVLPTHRDRMRVVDQTLDSWTKHRCTVSHKIFVYGRLTILKFPSPRQKTRMWLS